MEDCKYTTYSKNNKVSRPRTTSKISPSGASTVATTSDNVVGAMNAFQLMAAKIATAPSTIRMDNVRKYIQTSLHGPASLRSAESKASRVLLPSLRAKTTHSPRFASASPRFVAYWNNGCAHCSSVTSRNRSPTVSASPPRGETHGIPTESDTGFGRQHER